MALPTVSERDFEQQVMSSELPVLVEFSAEWCGPCKVVEPELVALSHELEGKAKLVKIDIDRSPNLARQLGVQSVPTFVVFHQGRPAAGRVGALKRQQLKEMLDPFLPRAEGALKPEEVAELLRQGRISVVDTREPAVFNRAHIASAVNIPFEEIETRLAELHMLPGPPVLYDRAGDRTKDLAAKLAEQGMPVAFLEGGVLGWEASGFGLERPD
ncbi:MAG: thioredoxin domain-containing protein [Myxococcota bacterium]|jgi:thioredoxin|nr:thioredoxin domain-containing protein [Myxococcota bacterium]